MSAIAQTHRSPRVVVSRGCAHECSAAYGGNPSSYEWEWLYRSEFEGGLISELPGNRVET